MFGEDFANGEAEVGGERKIAPFVQLVIREPGPLSVDLAAANCPFGVRQPSCRFSSCRAHHNYYRVDNNTVEY